jgi:hypothetical protein
MVVGNRSRELKPMSVAIAKRGRTRIERRVLVMTVIL